MATGYDFQSTSGSSKKRTRNQTAKGREFQRQLHEDQRSSAQRGWRRQINNIENCLADSTDPNKLQSERNFLESKMDILVSAQERFLDTLEDSEAKRVAQDKFEMWEREHSDALKRVNSKITELKNENQSLLSSATASSGRKSKVSLHSMKSRSSSKVSHSSAIIDKKTETAVKLAKIKTELNFAEGEAAKVAELKKFKLTKELAIAQAEMNAITKVEESELGLNDGNDRAILPGFITKDDLLQNYLVTQASSVAIDSPSTVQTGLTETKNPLLPTTSFPIAKSLENDQLEPRIEDSNNPGFPVINYPSSLNPFAQEYVALSTPEKAERTSLPIAQCKQSTPNSIGLNFDQSENSPNRTTGDVLERLADLMTQRYARESLPLPEPETFKGDLLHYPSWRKSFDTIVEKRTDSPSQRLYYLGRYTAGEAKEAISGLLTLESTNAYHEARKILSDRFGNPFLVANAYRKKINDWPRILPNDGISLRKFSDFLVNCQTAMKEIHYLTALNDPEENQKMISKLPRNICDRWGREVDHWLNMRGQELQKPTARKSPYPPFSAFCDFLKREARIACNPVTMARAEEEVKKVETSQQRLVKFSNRKKKPLGANSLATGSEEVSSGNKGERKQPERCRLCKNTHNLNECDKFKKILHTERIEFVKSNGLCLGCLKYGHMKKDCRGKKVCSTCKGFHSTSLHTNVPKPEGKPGTSPKNSSAEVTSHRVSTHEPEDGSFCDSHSLIVPVWLYQRGYPEKKELVYALLDDQSDACFVSEEILQKLAISGPQVQLKLSTVLGEDFVACQKINDLVVRGVNENQEVMLPKTYSRKEIPAKRGQIPRPETVKKWPHLKRIEEHLLPYQHDAYVGLLIGANCTKAIKPREVIPGADDDPYAVRTTLGWGVIGVINQSTIDSQENSYCSCNRIVSREIEDSLVKTVSHVVAKTSAKELFVPAQVSRMFEHDFSEVSKEEKTLSFLDRRFLNTLESNIQRLSNGHYEILLPLKEERLKLPNNRNLALSRLHRLNHRLKKDSKYRSHYETFMKDMIDKGQAEKVPDNELHLDNGRVWYIPHHGVYHPQKPDKIRVVFDASAEFNGESLNKHLLQGPDLTNNLTGVLCRFRKETVAFTCDVEGMFHQVYVHPDSSKISVVGQKNPGESAGRVQNESPPLWCCIVPRVCELRTEKNRRRL